MILIFLVLVVFSVINRPSKEQIEMMKHRQDSIQQVEAERQRQLEQQTETIASEDLIADTLLAEEALRQKESQLGAFGAFASGEEKFHTLENNLLKMTLSNKGGRVYSVELKEYKTHDGKPLILFEGDRSQFSLNFFHRTGISRPTSSFSPRNHLKPLLLRDRKSEQGIKGMKNSMQKIRGIAK